MGAFDLGEILCKWKATQSHLERFLFGGETKLLGSFKGIASVSVFKGDTCYFWQDL
jgi:hypothetical protein